MKQPMEILNTCQPPPSETTDRELFTSLAYWFVLGLSIARVARGQCHGSWLAWHGLHSLANRVLNAHSFYYLGLSIWIFTVGNNNEIHWRMEGGTKGIRYTPPWKSMQRVAFFCSCLFYLYFVVWMATVCLQFNHSSKSCYYIWPFQSKKQISY